MRPGWFVCLQRPQVWPIEGCGKRCGLRDRLAAASRSPHWPGAVNHGRWELRLAKRVDAAGKLSRPARGLPWWAACQRLPIPALLLGALYRGIHQRVLGIQVFLKKTISLVREEIAQVEYLKHFGDIVPLIFLKVYYCTPLWSWDVQIIIFYSGTIFQYYAICF